MIELPVEFSEYTRHLLGEEEYTKLVAALMEEPSVSLRINPRKSPVAELAGMSRVPWSQWGFYPDGRPQFTLDPLFHAGCYYVQEASSMFVEQVLRTYVTSPCAMLDLCAAPGGKSTLARTVLPEGSLLVSNEIIHTRAQVLAENMIKWGHPATVVTNSAPADFSGLTDFFDVILADVPCSGEGMFRKDEASVGEWSAANVDTCWKRQHSIVAEVWECLKPGGLFIYSTCTYNALENEENVRWMQHELGAEVLEVPALSEWGIGGDVTGSGLPVCRFFPSHVRGEGFFLAALRKPMDDAPEAIRAFHAEEMPRMAEKGRKSGRRERKPMVSVPQECRAWVKDESRYAWQVEGEMLTAFPLSWEGALERLKTQTKVIHAGVGVAVMKGREWTPLHQLAMSAALVRGCFPEAELSPEEAIAYLRHEGLVLDSAIPRGPVLLTYRGVPLGFVKNIGNRANNLYPNEWRIRSGYGVCGDVL